MIHAKSEAAVELRKHVFGIESHITACDNEFTGRVNEDAEGYIAHQKLTTPATGPNCIRRPCEELDANQNPFKHEWPAHGDEAHVPGVDGETGVSPVNGHREVMVITFCVEPIGGGTDESCETSVPFNQTTAGNAEFGDTAEIAGHGFSGFRCELIGHWNTETTSSAEGTPNEVTINHKAAENLAENP